MFKSSFIVTESFRVRKYGKKPSGSVWLSDVWREKIVSKEMSMKPNKLWPLKKKLRNFELIKRMCWGKK